MILTKDDIEKIRKVELATRLDLTKGSYYAKKAYDAENNYNGLDLAINEVINAELLKQIGIISPNIEIYMPRKTNESEVFILSEDLATLGNFKTAAALGLTRDASSSLYDIWNFLTEKYRDNFKIQAKIPEIFREIVTMYFYDMLMGNWDRLGDNWGLLFNADESEILSLAVFDNEFHLDNFIPNISTLPNGSDWHQKRKEILKLTGEEYENGRIAAIKEDLRRFFYESSSEFYELFAKIYETLTPEFYQQTLETIEQTKVVYTSRGIFPLEINNKDELITEYSKNYGEIGEIWQEAIHGRK